MSMRECEGAREEGYGSAAVLHVFMLSCCVCASRPVPTNTSFGVIWRSAQGGRNGKISTSKLRLDTDLQVKFFHSISFCYKYITVAVSYSVWQFNPLPLQGSLDRIRCAIKWLMRAGKSCSNPVELFGLIFLRTTNKSISPPQSCVLLVQASNLEHSASFYTGMLKSQKYMTKLNVSVTSKWVNDV